MKNCLFIIMLSALFGGCASNHTGGSEAALLTFDELAAEISVQRIPAEDAMDMESLVAIQ